MPIRRHLIKKLTALDELAKLGTKSNRRTEQLRGTVIICGGSIAGLLVAKVCSDHFENVVTVESEEWVTTPDAYTGSHRKELANKKRSHVAQYNAAHMFQTFLVKTLAKWFPDFKKECERMGGRIIPQMWPIVISGIPFADDFPPKGRTHPTTVRITRAGFEIMLRRLVMNSCENVRYVAGTVLGLEQTDNTNVITGVRVKTASKEITLSAILAIDCTGASSAGLRWLRDLANAAKNEEAVKQLDNLRLTYDPKQSYRTIDLDIPPELIPRLMDAGFPSGWDSTGMVLTVFPDLKLENKFFSITRKDNNYLELLCGGWAVSDEISSIEDIRSYIHNLKVYKPLPTWSSEW